MVLFLHCIYIKVTTMKKLFLFLLIVLGLSSCSEWYYPSTYDTSYSDYRYSTYSPYWFWTDVIYSPYYSNYYNHFTFGFYNYYGFYSYYGYPHYNYYNYYGLYNHHYYNHYKHNNYAYTYPQKRVVNKPVYRRSASSTISKADKPKTYPTRRGNKTIPSTYTRPVKQYRSNTAIQRATNAPVYKTTNRPVKNIYRPTQQRSLPVQRTIKHVPVQRRSVSRPVNRNRTTTIKRKN